MLLADAAALNAQSVTTRFLEQIFGGDTPIEPLQLHQIAARAILVYLIGLVIVRFGKSRIISRTTTLDVILGFILGSLLSRGITGLASISGTTVASAVIVAMHWVLTDIAFRSHEFGRLIKGNARQVVENGRLLIDNMQRSHISENDLLEQMRFNGVDNLQEVRAAFKERNGEISVLKRKPAPRILDVAVQDGVQTVRIALEA